MNITSILKTAWRITWHAWPLWVINLFLVAGLFPALGLAGAIGGVAGALALPGSMRAFPFVAALQRIPVWGWVLMGAATFVLLVIAAMISWALQAAAMRGAALAAEQGRVSLGEALNLGWRRLASLFSLSLTFGALILLLGLLPTLAAFILVNRLQAGLALMNMLQVSLAPINAALGVALFLVMMSVALEDLRPLAAMRRAWRVFRQGWWGFLFVYGFTVALAVPWLLLIAPLVVAAIALGINPRLGFVVLVAGCGLSAPVALFFGLFTAVFTTVLYTLVYRAAADQLAAPIAG